MATDRDDSQHSTSSNPKAPDARQSSEWRLINKVLSDDSDSNRWPPLFIDDPKEPLTPAEVIEPDSAERPLWAAVITQALKDLFNQEYRQDALKFFANKEIKPGSFAWILQHITEEPEYLQEKILQFIYKEATNLAGNRKYFLLVKRK